MDEKIFLKSFIGTKVAIRWDIKRKTHRREREQEEVTIFMAIVVLLLFSIDVANLCPVLGRASKMHNSFRVINHTE